MVTSLPYPTLHPAAGIEKILENPANPASQGVFSDLHRHDADPGHEAHCRQIDLLLSGVNYFFLPTTIIIPDSPLAREGISLPEAG